MRMLAVSRFTLLRLSRTRYILAGLILVALILLTYLANAAGGAPASLNDLVWPENLARWLLWLTAIWLGINLVHDDRADGTLRSTLTRPISLLETLFGKLLGGWLALALLASGVAAALTVAALLKGVPFHPAMLTFQLALLPGHLLVLSLALCLGQAMPRFAAAVLVLFADDGFYTAKTLARAAEWLPGALVATIAPVAKVLYWLSPSVSLFYLSFRDFVYQPPTAAVWLLGLPYTLHYAFLAGLLAAALLGRKEL